MESSRFETGKVAFVGQENLTQTMLDAFPCIALLICPTTREIIASNKAAILVGAVPGKKCYSTWGQRSDACPWCLAPKVWKTSEAQHVEVEALGVVWDAHWIPVAPDLYMHFAFDVTERKKAERDLQKAAKVWQTTFDSIDDFVSIHDTDFKLVKVNKAFARTYKGEPADFIGKKCHEICHGTAEPHASCPHQRALETGNVSCSEIFEPRLGLYLDISASPIRNDAGEIIGSVRVARNVSERKKAAEELKNTQENYRRSFDESPLGIRVVNGDGETTYANLAVLDIFGNDRIEEFKATPVRDRYTPESYTEHQIRKGKRKHGGFVSPNYEISIVRKDGKIRHLEVHRKEVIWNGLQQFQVIYEDITERKTAEEALRQNEKRLTATIKNSPIGIAISGVDRRFINANDAFCKILGYTEAELCGLSFKDITHPEDVSGSVANMKVLDLGNSDYFTQEKRYVKKDGKVMIGKVMVSAIRDQGGKPELYVAELEDITERKLAEEALRASEEKLRLMFESITDSIIVTDLNGQIEECNESTLRTFGYTDKRELVGRNTFEFVAAKDHLWATENMKKTREDGHVRNVEYTCLARDGKEIPVELSAALLKDSTGTASGFIAIVKDITKRKQAEIERAELELKAQMASRLATIGEMAAGIAHEINNPLTPILGFSEMLKNADFPKRFKPEIQVIYESAKRTADVTRRLLAFARQSKPQRTLCNINDLAESTLQLKSYTFKTNNIQVIKEFDPELPQTIADCGQLQQVLLNLVMNAEYQMTRSNNGGTITVKTEKLGNNIRVSVADDGPGIPPEIFDKLFTLFFTTKKEGEGSGIGLNICRGIMAEHHGKIWAEKTPGKGATFVLELPIVTQSKNAGAKTPVADLSNLPAVAGAKILVVDDEPTIVRLLKRLLSAEGYVVRATNRSMDALKLIQACQFDLIILDVKLPDMSGIELFHYLEKTEHPCYKKIIFITGDTVGTNTAGFFAATRVSYLAKPFSSEFLIQEVKKKLNELRAVTVEE